MSEPSRQRGFSMIGLLLTVAIIGIISVTALQEYKSVLPSMRPGGGNATGFGTETAKLHMKQLHQMETLYFSIHRSYATWDQLVSDGEIQRGYSNKGAGKGTPFIPNYDIDIQVNETGFVITATPNLSAGAVVDAPSFKIDQDGYLEEVPPK